MALALPMIHLSVSAYPVGAGCGRTVRRVPGAGRAAVILAGARGWKAKVKRSTAGGAPVVPLGHRVNGPCVASGTGHFRRPSRENGARIRRADRTLRVVDTTVAASPAGVDRGVWGHPRRKAGKESSACVVVRSTLSEAWRRARNSMPCRPAIRGEMPARPGRREEARSAFLHALELCTNAADCAALERKLDAVADDNTRRPKGNGVPGPPSRRALVQRYPVASSPAFGSQLQQS